MLGFFEKKPKSDPSVAKYVALNGNLETNVRGIYMAGDITGFPLLKTSINQGHDLVDSIASELKGLEVEDGYALVIIGAGGAGISAAMKARELGVKYILLEKSTPAATIKDFYSGKKLFAEPEGETTRGELWFEECSKEELLEKWSRILEEKKLNVRNGFNVKDIKRNADGNFDVVSDAGETERGARVIIAVGKQGDRRTLGVPGEDRDKVMYAMYNPEKYSGKKIIVVGAGDQAAETALALCDGNSVSMVARGSELTRPRKRNIEALRRKEQAGALNMLFNTEVKEIGETAVTLKTPDGDKTVENDIVFINAGSEPPWEFLARAGIRASLDWTTKRILAFALGFTSLLLMYLFKAYWMKDLLAFYGLKSAADISNPVLSFLVKYWYGILYTTCVLGFGWHIISVPRRRHLQLHDYVRMRTISCMFFQTVFLLLLPMLPIKYIASRAWMLITVWPLSQSPVSIANKVFVHGSKNPELVFYAFFTAFLAFVAMPVFVYFHGKRYCSWICGCGALAETVGEPFRHLAPRGYLNRRREGIIYIVLFASVVMSGLILMNGKVVDGATVSSATKWYNAIVYLTMSSIIGVGMYPFFGARIWCRYFCPLAAYMNLLGALMPRFGIKSNDRCIDCGQCNRYCEMGIDVKGFALKQERFTLRNTPCIGCGECVAVCPMDVLSFD